MSDKFEQISITPGFMKHNGGIMFRNISETEYEFKTTINKNHLNAVFVFLGRFLLPFSHHSGDLFGIIFACWGRPKE